jgi:hypothetical protein
MGLVVELFRPVEKAEQGETRAFERMTSGPPSLRTTLSVRTAISTSHDPGRFVQRQALQQVCNVQLALQP